MDRQVLVSLFETIVFSDIVKVIASDDNCSVHFCFHNNTGEDAAADRNVTSEWTLFVDICAVNGLSWCLEAQANISSVTQ
jgi:hypothetical protein